MSYKRFHVVLNLFWLCAVAAAAQDDKGQNAPQRKALNPNPAGKKAQEPLTPELAVLDQFAGPWEVRESHLNSRGEVVATAKGIEEGAWVLDRSVLQRTYITGEEGSLFRAIGLVAWNADQKRYEGTWFDNVRSGGPTTVTGTWDSASRTMTYTLVSIASDGMAVQHKVVDKFVDDERRMVTTFKVDGSLVEKVLEVQYARAEPCPPNVGIVPEFSGKPKKP